MTDADVDVMEGITSSEEARSMTSSSANAPNNDSRILMMRFGFGFELAGRRSGSAGEGSGAVVIIVVVLVLDVALEEIDVADSLLLGFLLVASLPEGGSEDKVYAGAATLLLARSTTSMPVVAVLVPTLFVCVNANGKGGNSSSESSAYAIDTGT